MGQNATLYRIGKDEFEKLAKEPSTFNVEMTAGDVLFQQNHEGLIFVLTKLSSDTQKVLVPEIFYPIDTLGEKVDMEKIDFDNPDDLLLLEVNPIGYLNAEKIKAIKLLLDGIDTQQVSAAYNAKELNDNGIYPCVWHNEESFDRVFNKRHIMEGFVDLVALFRDAAENDNLIVVFA